MALVIPEIFADAINEKLGVSLKVGSLAFDATDMVGEIRQSGDTVHFPIINRITDATELTDGVEVTPERVSMQDNTAEIKEIGKGVRVLDREEIQIKGGAMDKMVVQLAEAMAKKIDLDLVAAMDADAVYKQATTGADAVTKTELDSAIGLFGDQIDSDTFAAWVINSRLVSSFMNMDAFVSTTLTHTTEGNGIVRNGVIGYLYNVPVMVSNNGTYDDAKKECKTYLIKKDALAYVFQKDITVEEERLPKLRATDIVTTSLYAVKLLDASGVAILRKTITEDDGE